jgi:outer membrane murein-binding lipoprotein Lpp
MSYPPGVADHTQEVTMKAAWLIVSCLLLLGCTNDSQKKLDELHDQWDSLVASSEELTQAVAGAADAKAIEPAFRRYAEALDAMEIGFSTDQREELRAVYGKIDCKLSAHRKYRECLSGTCGMTPTLFLAPAGDSGSDDLDEIKRCIARCKADRDDHLGRCEAIIWELR